MPQHQLTIRRGGPKVAWILGSRRVCEFGWRAGDELCRAIRLVLDGKEDRVTVKGCLFQRGAPGMVVFSVGGKVVTDGRDADFLALTVATTAQCRLVEEEECAEQIAFDGALLLRGGAPIGLTDNPKIKDMVRAEASTNKTLRTALPGMRDTTLHGAPVIRHVNPLQRLLSMNPSLVKQYVN